jgi:membrane-associated phospholipid phosphatase
MLNKLTASIIFLSASLLSFPAHAASSIKPDPGIAATSSQLLSGTSVAEVSAPAAAKVSAPAAAEVSAPEQQEAKPGEAATSDVDSINLKYVKGYFVDTGKILVSPLHWETGDWIKLGLVLGATSSLFLVDEKVRDFAQDHQSPVASKFAMVGNAFGNTLYALPPVGAFYLYGYLADDSKARRASLLSIESFTISQLLTSGLKMLADRHRPNTGDSSTTWDGPSFSQKNLSFSSGHTASAFSLATVFADVYKDNPYVAPIAYGLATLTGLSRVYSNEHWSSDALFGAAIGYFTSRALLSYHKEETKKSAKRLTILPEIGKEMTGLTVKYEF